MQTFLDKSIAASYTSASQIARVVSERWLLANMYCLNCDTDRLQPTPANTGCKDFFCHACQSPYELKTFSRRPPTSLIDGAYASMVRSMKAGSTPILLLLERDMDWRVANLSAIHPAFLTLHVIDKRKPLAASARRAGWVGCNIRLDKLPVDAEIAIVKSGEPVPTHEARTSYQRLSPISTLPLTDRGWTTLTLQIIRQLRGPSFSLQAVYKMEAQFAKAYPGNNNVRAKIRQQLQQLRDLGLIEFKGRGSYRFSQ